MNRRVRCLYTIAAFALVLFAPIASQAQLSPQWANGYWKIAAVGKEFNSGLMCLSQQGYMIVGKAASSTTGSMTGMSPNAGRAIAIHGKLVNNRLDGTWTASPGGDTGWLTINFGPTFRTFNGEYGHAGKKPMGNLTGTFYRRASCV